MAKAAKKQAPQTTPTPATESDELDTLLREHAVIRDRMDALEEMGEARRARILLLMRERALSRHDADAGSAVFSDKRSFKVKNPDRLAELMTPKQLAANVKITAEVFDAVMAEKIPLDEAVIVGRTETLTISRGRTKAEQERRRGYIDESKRQAEERIRALRETYRDSKAGA